jgi:hypothetical protein
MEKRRFSNESRAYSSPITRGACGSCCITFGVGPPSDFTPLIISDPSDFTSMPDPSDFAAFEMSGGPSDFVMSAPSDAANADRSGFARSEGRVVRGGGRVELGWRREDH